MADGTKMAQTPIRMKNANPMEYVYVTTAIADEGIDVRFGTGNSSIVGSGSTDDLVAHRWQLSAFDKRSGKPVWDKTVHRGVQGQTTRQSKSRIRPRPTASGSHECSQTGVS